MVKQSKKQQDDKQGGAIDLGTVATPIVLYGLHALLKDDGKKVMASVTKPMKKFSRGFAKRGGAAEDGDVAVEMDMAVSGVEETQEDFSNYQLGGKKPWGKGKKMMKKGGDQQEQEQEQDGGKKKRAARKQKGGDQEQEQEQDQDQEQDGGKKKRAARKQKGGDQQDQEQEQDGGKKKKRAARKMKKGGAAEDGMDMSMDMSGMEETQEDFSNFQDGGKKKKRSARKQKGGDSFAALEDYYKMPLTQPGPVVDTSDVSTQDAGVTTAPAPPQIGGKKKGKGKKGGSAALANVLQNMGIGMVNYDQFGNLASGEQQGGALEQYTQQLQQLSERLDKMIREGGQKQDGGKKKAVRKQKK
jgi:hypothetical protein